MGIFRGLQVYLSRWFYILVCLACVFPLFLTTAKPVYAQNHDLPIQNESGQKDAVDCTPVDMVFIIDQTDVLEDPGKIRNQVVYWTEILMSADELYRCPNIEHHIMWMDMDTKTVADGTNPSEPVQKPIIDLGPIPIPSNIDPINDQGIDSFNAWQDRIKKDFEATIASIRPSNSRNYLNSIKSALAALKNGQHANHKKVIIIIAGDQGIPCVKGVPCQKDDMAYHFYNNISDAIGAFPFSSEYGPFVYMLGFQNVQSVFEDSLIQYAAQIKNVTDKYNGETYPVNQIWQLNQKVTDIFQKYTAPYLQKVNSGKFLVEPFLQNQQFFIFRPSEASEVKITPPDSNSAKFPFDAGIENANKFINIMESSSLPTPGSWDIRADNEVMIYPHAVPMKGVQISTSEVQEKYYQAKGDTKNCVVSEAHLSFQIKDQYGELIPYPAFVEPKIITPNKAEKDLAYEFDQAKDVYSIEDPLPIDESGTYAWTISAYKPIPGTTNTGEKIAELSGSYQVASVQFIKPVVDVPKGTKLTLHGEPFGDHWLKVNPVSFTLHFEDEGGNPIPAATLFQNGATASQGFMLSFKELGTGDIDSKPLAPKGPDSNEFLATNMGIEKANIVGDYQTWVDENTNTQLNPGYCWLPVQGKDLFAFTRKDTLPTSPMTWYGIAGFCMAVVLALLIKLVIDHIHPVKGQLAFYYPAGSQPFYSLKLNDFGKRKVVHGLGSDKKRKLELNPLLRFIDFVEAKMLGDNIIVHFAGHDFQGEAQNPQRIEPSYEKDETPAGGSKNPNAEYRLPHAIYVRYIHPNYRGKPPAPKMEQAAGAVSPGIETNQPLEQPEKDNPQAEESNPDNSILPASG